MGVNDDEYWVPEHVRAFLRGLGFTLPLEDMEPHIRAWDRWMRALGDFYDYRDTDGVGGCTRCTGGRSTRDAGVPGVGVAAAERQDAGGVRGAGVHGLARGVDGADGVPRLGAGVRGAGVRAGDRGVCPVGGRRVRRGAGAPVRRADGGASHVGRGGRDGVRVRDAGVLEGACHRPGAAASAGCRRGVLLAKRIIWRASTAGSSRLSDGESEGTYRIVTACFDRDGNRVEPEGVCPVYDTGSTWPTFSLVKPAIDNTRVDTLDRVLSVFADAVDAIQAVDLCYDAMMSEIDNGKMRVFLSDVMFDTEHDGKGGRVSIPFGKADCTVFRKVMSTEDTIHEFAPTLRTEAQARAFRVALQTLGDLCGFGLDYFDLDKTGYLRTATEVSADNSALMRNIRRHEHALEGSLAGICHALLAAERHLGTELPERAPFAWASTTASSRTRRPRRSRTWTRWLPASCSPGSTAPSGTARTRRRRAGVLPQARAV